jgi:CRISPR-associated protein Csd2
MQHTDPARRHDFVLIFDVTDGNPNGDPDGGNLPRTDPETMQGIVTDVCLKRKVRDYVTVASDNAVYVEHKGVSLYTQHHKAFDALSTDPKKATTQDRSNAREWMCENFYDVRMFGAVLSVGQKEGLNAGQVRGPVQFTFARSVDPVLPLDLGITRVAITREEERADGKETEMGRKTLIPYGLYVAHGFYSPQLAAQTGVTEEDLTLFWQALTSMWEFDRSAARGLMATQGLYVFTHESALGNAPAHKLFNRIRVEHAEDVEAPRRFEDYTVTVDDDLPPGVTLTPVVEARTGAYLG